MSDNDYFSKMRTDFEDFYYKNLWFKLVSMEEVRLKYLHRFWLLFLGLCLAMPLFCLWMWGETFYNFLCQASSKEIESIIKISLLIGIVIIAIVGSPIISYKIDVKDSIIEDFIGFFGSFKHSLYKHIDDKTIEHSRLLNSYNRHYGDDYFHGLYKKVHMVISEEEMAVKHNKGESIIFKGIMVLLDFPKPFKGQTVVFKDWGCFNFLHTSGIKFQKIKLEDVVFEKEFEVYGTDQIEARYLLTAAFMDRILQIKNAFGGKKIQFSFFDNQLLIAINTSKDMFEPSSLFKSSTDRRPINDVLEQFISVFAIVELLKLTQQ